MSKEHGMTALAAGYPSLLAVVKKQIAGSRIRALTPANAELVTLYWRIGRLIVDRQATHGRPARVVGRGTKGPTTRRSTRKCR